jgi:release factor glutamine methyltransferase
MPSDAGTVGEALDAATTVLRDAGIPEPRHEALRIWADLSRKNPAEVVMQSRQVALPETVRPFSAAVARRAAGEPLAYVTGWAGFRRLTLCSDARALIPRPETEGLVDAALERVRTGTAADIGTGTGAIALALKAEGEFSEVFGLDRSADALALARTNGLLTGLSVTWLEGDLLAPLAGRQVDLLVSNPPYLTEEEYASLDASVRDYEPQLALVAGEDGQALLRRLVVDAGSVVVSGGWLALEVDCRRAAETARLAMNAGWQEITVLDDLFGRARYVLARQGSS